MGNERILIIEDETSIYELLSYNLQQAGYSVDWARDGQEGLKLFQTNRPDLVLLDLMLPTMDGLKVCETIRQQDGYTTPIIMITAKNEEVDRILGLELGADDYITKPFSVREVLARVRALLRRITFIQEEDVIIRGPLLMKPREYYATYHNNPLTLTPKEYALLFFLAKHPGRVVTRDEALEKIWGYDYPGDTRTVDVHIRQLRSKLGQICEDPIPIETLRGVGYRWRHEQS